MTTRCSLCNNPLENAYIKGVKTDTKSYDIFMCRHCSVGVTVPVPLKEELEKFYSSGDYRSLTGGKRFNPFVEFFIYLSRLLRKRRIESRVKKGRVLDIGCGRGLALEVLRRDGWEVAGVEFSEEAASGISGTYGINVVSGDPENWGFPAEYFDVITINHVLEHLERPSLMLDECNRLLRKGGLLVCAVPDISSLQAASGKAKWFHLDVPYHIHHFTEYGLLRLLQNKGFKSVKINRMDFEHNLFGWLQTLFNLTGFKKNLLYNLLKNRELRKKTLGTVSAGKVVLTFLLLPLYMPLSLALSIFESYVLKRGGTVTVYAVKE